jgi:hypothetical protein
MNQAIRNIANATTFTMIQHKYVDITVFDVKTMDTIIRCSFHAYMDKANVKTVSNNYGIVATVFFTTSKVLACTTTSSSGSNKGVGLVSSIRRSEDVRGTSVHSSTTTDQ